MRRTSTLLFCALALGANAQLLDPAFATNGYTQDNNLRGPATSLTVRPDGTIITGLDQRSYQNWETGFTRTSAYTGDGMPITGYGTGGVCSGFAWGEDAVVQQVTAMPDNRTLYVGYAEYCVELVCGLPNFLLGRITAAGVVDSTFGVNGLVRSNELFGPLVMGAWGERLIRLNNGQILAAGTVYMQGGYVDVFVARINENGTVDTSFGPNGTGYYMGGYETNQECVNLALDAAGNIYVTGETQIGQQLTAFVTKLDPNGEVVQAFGIQGTSNITVAERFRPRAIDLHNDGRIVLAGELRNELGGVQDTVYRAFVAELMPDGSLSNNMPGGYRVLTTPMPSGQITHIHIMADDRILVAGSTNTGLLMGNNAYKGIIGRLNDDGTWDNTFNGVDPNAIYDLSVSTLTGTFITDFIPLDNGQILACGGRYYQGSLQSALVMRITPDGMNAGINEAAATPIISVYPQPVSSTLNVQFDLSTTYRVTLSLIDPLGRTEHVFLQNTPVTSTTLARRFEIPEDIANGVHVLSLTTSDGLRSTARLVVQR